MRAIFYFKLKVTLH